MLPGLGWAMSPSNLRRSMSAEWHNPPTVNPGSKWNPWLINGGCPLLVEIHHFRREHPPSGTGSTYILGRHYSTRTFILVPFPPEELSRKAMTSRPQSMRPRNEVPDSSRAGLEVHASGLEDQGLSSDMSSRQ